MFPYVSMSDIPPVSDFWIVNQATDSKDPLELERLSRYEDPHVVARVAENRNTPISVLERIALREDQYAVYIKSYLLRNPVLPYGLLRQFINVDSKPLREKVLLKLLDGYKRAVVELSGDEVHTLLRALAPEDMNSLEFIDLLESIHERRDEAKKTL
jgi:hypothetical protein